MLVCHPISIAVAALCCDDDECPAVELTIALISTDPTCPPMTPDGSVIGGLVTTATSLEGDCCVASCALPANIGVDSTTYVPNSFYRASVTNVDTGQELIAPIDFQISADVDYSPILSPAPCVGIPLTFFKGVDGGNAAVVDLFCEQVSNCVNPLIVQVNGAQVGTYDPIAGGLINIAIDEPEDPCDVLAARPVTPNNGIPSANFLWPIINSNGTCFLTEIDLHAWINARTSAAATLADEDQIFVFRADGTCRKVPASQFEPSQCCFQQNFGGVSERIDGDTPVGDSVAMSSFSFTVEGSCPQDVDIGGIAKVRPLINTPGAFLQIQYDWQIVGVTGWNASTTNLLYTSDTDGSDQQPSFTGCATLDPGTYTIEYRWRKTGESANASAADSIALLQSRRKITTVKRAEC